MFLQEILNQVPGTELKGNPLVRILGISYDSRKVRDGHLFVAIKGEKTDGTQFVGEALERGAVAVASERTVEVPAEMAALRVPDAAKIPGSSLGRFLSKSGFGAPSGGHYRHQWQDHYILSNSIRSSALRD